MMIRASMIALGLLLSVAVADRGLAQDATAVEPAPAPGAPVPQYRVEVMVFAYQDVDATEERLNHGSRPAQRSTDLPVRREPRRFDDPDLLESLTPEPNRFGDDVAVPASPDNNPAAFRFRVLRADELQLTSQYQALGRLPAYRALLHGGWVQQGLPEDQARPFDLSLLGSMNPTGSISLHLSRFLHLKLNLSYQTGGRFTPPAEPTLNASELTELQLPPHYSLITERRTRSGELHYFDHPAFGVLIMVTPLPAEGTPAGSPGAKPAA